MSNSLQPHGRCLHPWNLPGKSTGVGCHFLLQQYFLECGYWAKYIKLTWKHLLLSHIQDLLSQVIWWGALDSTFYKHLPNDFCVIFKTWLIQKVRDKVFQFNVKIPILFRKEAWSHNYVWNLHGLISDFLISFLKIWMPGLWESYYVRQEKTVLTLSFI